MAYFIKEEELAVLVAPNLVKHIMEDGYVNSSDICVIKFNFMNNEYKILSDKQFAENHRVKNYNIFDLEAEGKEDVFFELKPVPESLFLRFLKRNNIVM